MIPLESITNWLISHWHWPAAHCRFALYGHGNSCRPTESFRLSKDPWAEWQNVLYRVYFFHSFFAKLSSCILSKDLFNSFVHFLNKFCQFVFLYLSSLFFVWLLASLFIRYYCFNFAMCLISFSVCFVLFLFCFWFLFSWFPFLVTLFHLISFM